MPLHTFAFPEKVSLCRTDIVLALRTTSHWSHNEKPDSQCILVMGDEKRGVPMALLRAADAVVHVEQLGRVR